LQGRAPRKGGKKESAGVTKRSGFNRPKKRSNAERIEKPSLSKQGKRGRTGGGSRISLGTKEKAKLSERPPRGPHGRNLEKAGKPTKKKTLVDKRKGGKFEAAKKERRLSDTLLKKSRDGKNTQSSEELNIAKGLLLGGRKRQEGLRGTGRESLSGKCKGER